MGNFIHCATYNIKTNSSLTVVTNSLVTIKCLIVHSPGDSRSSYIINMTVKNSR